MNFGQIMIFLLMATNLLIGAYLHGKPKTGEHDFWTVLIANMIFFIVLYIGGFFS